MSPNEISIENVCHDLNDVYMTSTSFNTRHKMLQNFILVRLQNQTHSLKELQQRPPHHIEKLHWMMVKGFEG